MDLHKLRVVNFSSPKDRSEDEANTSNKKHEDNKNIEKPIHEVRFVEKGAGDQSATTSGNAEAPKSPNAGKRRTCNNQVSKKTQSKSKKSASKNVLKIDNPKISKNNESSLNRRVNFFNREPILNLNHKGVEVQINKIRDKKKEEDNVPLTSEIHKLKEKSPTTPAKTERIKENNNNSQSHYDVYGFSSSQRSINPCLYQMSCNYLDVDKSTFKNFARNFRHKQEKQRESDDKKKQQILQPQKEQQNKQLDQQKKKSQRRKEPVRKHQQIKVLSLSSLNSWQRKNSSMIYYNLINGLHPQNGPKVQKVTHSKIRPNNKDENVAVSPSSLPPILKCCHDAACGSSRYEIPKPVVNSCQVIQNTSTPKSTGPGYIPKPGISKHKIKEKEVRSKHDSLISGLTRRITTIHADRLKKRSPKDYLKYVFFGLLIIVWSPCLLAVILAWIIKSPVRTKKSLGSATIKKTPVLTSLMNKMRKKSDNQQTSSTNSRPQQKRALPSVSSWYTRLANTTANSFYAVRSLLNLNKSACANSTFVSSKPNAKNRQGQLKSNNTVISPVKCNAMRCEYIAHLCNHDSKASKCRCALPRESNRNRSEFVYRYHPPPCANIPVCNDCVCLDEQVNMTTKQYNSDIEIPSKAPVSCSGIHKESPNLNEINAFNSNKIQCVSPSKLTSYVVAPVLVTWTRETKPHFEPRLKTLHSRHKNYIETRKKHQSTSTSRKINSCRILDRSRVHNSIKRSIIQYKKKSPKEYHFQNQCPCEISEEQNTEDKCVQGTHLEPSMKDIQLNNRKPLEHKSTKMRNLRENHFTPLLKVLGQSRSKVVNKPLKKQQSRSTSPGFKLETVDKKMLKKHKDTVITHKPPLCYKRSCKCCQIEESLNVSPTIKTSDCTDRPTKVLKYRTELNSRDGILHCICDCVDDTKKQNKSLSFDNRIAVMKKEVLKILSLLRAVKIAYNKLQKRKSSSINKSSVKQSVKLASGKKCLHDTSLFNETIKGLREKLQNKSLRVVERFRYGKGINMTQNNIKCPCELTKEQSLRAGECVCDNKINQAVKIIIDKIQEQSLNSAKCSSLNKEITNKYSRHKKIQTQQRSSTKTTNTSSPDITKSLQTHARAIKCLFNIIKEKSSKGKDIKEKNTSLSIDQVIKIVSEEIQNQSSIGTKCVCYNNKTKTSSPVKNMQEKSLMTIKGSSSTKETKTSFPGIRIKKYPSVNIRKESPKFLKCGCLSTEVSSITESSPSCTCRIQQRCACSLSDDTPLCPCDQVNRSIKSIQYERFINGLNTVTNSSNSSPPSKTLSRLKCPRKLIKSEQNLRPILSSEYFFAPKLDKIVITPRHKHKFKLSSKRHCRGGSRRTKFSTKLQSMFTKKILLLCEFSGSEGQGKSRSMPSKDALKSPEKSSKRIPTLKDMTPLSLTPMRCNCSEDEQQLPCQHCPFKDSEISDYKRSQKSLKSKHMSTKEFLITAEENQSPNTSNRKVLPTVPSMKHPTPSFKFKLMSPESSLSPIDSGFSADYKPQIHNRPPSRLGIKYKTRYSKRTRKKRTSSRYENSGDKSDLLVDNLLNEQQNTLPKRFRHGEISKHLSCRFQETPPSSLSSNSRKKYPKVSQSLMRYLISPIPKYLDNELADSSMIPNATVTSCNDQISKSIPNFKHNNYNLCTSPLDIGQQFEVKAQHSLTPLRSKSQQILSNQGTPYVKTRLEPDVKKYFFQENAIKNLKSSQHLISPQSDMSKHGQKMSVTTNMYSQLNKRRHPRHKKSYHSKNQMSYISGTVWDTQYASLVKEYSYDKGQSVTKSLCLSKKHFVVKRPTHVYLSKRQSSHANDCKCLSKKRSSRAMCDMCKGFEEKRKPHKVKSLPASHTLRPIECRYPVEEQKSNQLDKQNSKLIKNGSKEKELDQTDLQQKINRQGEISIKIQKVDKKRISMWKEMVEEVRNIERAAWPDKITCKSMPMHMMVEKPHFWLYKLCPYLYPKFINLCKVHTNICSLFSYVMSACVWCPLLFCSYCLCNLCLCGFLI